MKKIKIPKRLSRVMAMFMIFCIGFAYCSGITAFAAIDLDITIMPPEEEVTNNQEFEVDLKIVTKSDNGYVELKVNIEYDASVLTLAAPVNYEGYRVSGNKGQLVLTYFDPTGTNTPTPIGNEVLVPIKFLVMENAPTTTTKIKATTDHAYNKKGKNIIWTPINDKEISIVRINGTTESEDEVVSQEVSSTFVVGNQTSINRTSSLAGNGGKVASVLLGAIVVFCAGIVVGYILCMHKYENSSESSKKASRRTDDYYDDYDDYGDYEDDYIGNAEAVGSNKNEAYSDSIYSNDEYDDNDDGFFTPSQTDYSVPDSDYFSSLPSSEQSGGNYLDAFKMTSESQHTFSPMSFDNLVSGSYSEQSSNERDDDDYPILFMSRSNSNNNSRRTQARPTFDENEDTVFGKYSDSIERNVDDGYGSGFSSSQSRRNTPPRNNNSRSERPVPIRTRKKR